MIISPQRLVAAVAVLRRLGGPQTFEKEPREIGGKVTDPARYETALNEARPGDRRDASTPRALAGSLRAYAVDDALEPADRDILNGWLRANATGGELIRAGVPDRWVVGDKTGPGGYGTRNDIAVIRPPDRAPIVLTVLSSRGQKDADYDDALIADATGVTSIVTRDAYVEMSRCTARELILGRIHYGET